jgi:peptidylprolyl isomerase
MEGAVMTAAKAGDTVSVHYTGRLENGTVFDSSSGRDPLQFRLGTGEVIAGFDEAVLGMTPGEERSVTIPADQAYGQHRDELLMVVSRSELPPEIQADIGQQLQLSQDGESFVVTITDVTEDDVVLDGNHPLAGEDLTFDLQLVDIS